MFLSSNPVTPTDVLGDNKRQFLKYCPVKFEDDFTTSIFFFLGVEAVELCCLKVISGLILATNC